MSNKTKTVFVAMSGGVDSSVAALLLKKKGFNVVGIFMKPWAPEKSEHILCQWEKDREDALRVAVKLEIPLLTWDFSDLYGKKVTKRMIEEYKKGLTPNPDIWCNQHIKFGAFLNKAIKEGADYIATGHYVRLGRINPKSKNSKQNKEIFELLKAVDKNKDQSYFLYTLSQKELKYCLFPIGGLFKSDVRKIARDSQLPVFNKKDSQGVCFVGELNMFEFLKKYIPQKKGRVVNAENAKAIGFHSGTTFYTIGQRHGFTIENSKSKAHYVSNKNTKKNILYVTSFDNLNSGRYTRKISVKLINWISKAYSSAAKVNVKLRYRQKDQQARLERKRGHVELLFTDSQKAVTPGQSAVFYDKEKMLGGGIIV